LHFRFSCVILSLAAAACYVNKKNKKICKGVKSMSKVIDEMAQSEKNEYLRNWRAKNKEKVKRYNNEYWKRKAHKKLAGQEGKK